MFMNIKDSDSSQRYQEIKNCDTTYVFSALLIQRSLLIQKMSEESRTKILNDVNQWKSDSVDMWLSLHRVTTKMLSLEIRVRSLETKEKTPKVNPDNYR